MTSYTATPKDIEKKWVLIDATDLVVGRLATIIAMHLRGKHKPTFTPHMDDGDFVVVVNAEKVVFTGRKWEQKVYYRHTGHPGGIKERRAVEVSMANFRTASSAKRWSACSPKARSAISSSRNLRVYAGPNHPHEAQAPVKTRRRIPQPQKREGSLSMSSDNLQSLSSLGGALKAAPEAVTMQRRCASAKSTRRAVPTPQASARTPLRASGSSPARARSPSMAAISKCFLRVPFLQMVLQQPLEVAKRVGQYDIICTVAGGGLSGQAGALRHGLSKALTLQEPELRGAAEKGRLPHARQPRGRAQEIRPRQGPPLVPVLASAKLLKIRICKRAAARLPFLLFGAVV